MRIVLGLVIVLAAATPAAAQDMRAQGTAAAVRAAVMDARAAPVVVRRQAPRSRWILPAKIAIGANGVCAFADLATSMYGFGAKTLNEQNKALAWAQDDPIAFAVVKGGMNVGATYVYVKGYDDHPLLTTIVAASTASLQCWAAGHNQREMEGR